MEIRIGGESAFMTKFQACKCFLRRGVAHLLDFVLMLFFANYLYQFLMEILQTEFVFSLWLGNNPLEVFFNVAILTVVILLVTNSLYYSLLESSRWQATLGKRLVGLIVADENGKRLTFARANLRYLCKWLSFFIVFLGFAVALFTRKQQALHDLIARTRVIDKYIEPATSSTPE